MKYLHFLDDGRLRIGKLLIQNSTHCDLKAIGLWLEFSCQEWEIVCSIGYGFGRIFFQLPHSLLYKIFPTIFWGKNFGEWGRGIGFMIGKRHQKYSLWWWADPNRPSHKWRARDFFQKF